MPKEVIRDGCFETNSSSMHSFLVTKNNVHIDPKELEDGDEYIYLHNGKWRSWDVQHGYGRAPFKLLTTLEDKFCYAICEYLGHFYGDEPECDKTWSEFEELAREIIPGFNEFDFPTKELDIYLDEEGNELTHDEIKYDHWEGDEAVYQYTDENGEIKIARKDPENWYEVFNVGSIDHQSAGLLRSFLKHKGITLKEFLTNKRYVVVIDGDEYCDWERYKKSGLIDHSFIVEEYPHTEE